MTWFTEGPWTIVIVAVLVEVVLGIALWRSGRGAILAAMGAVLAIAAVLVVVERLIVTDREQIAATLDGAAASLETNELDAVLRFVSPNAHALRADVRSVLSQFTFQEVRVAGELEIQFNRLVAPPAASARFIGRINIRDRRGQIPYENYVDRFTVLLEQHGGEWLISGYETRARRSP